MKQIFKKLIYIFSITYLCFFTSYAEEISEIMYDPAGSDTGNEWVEIYNNTSGDIDLTTYKLREANVNHSISQVASYTNPNGNTLTAGEYAVIVDNPATFLNSHPGFTGKLFDSSFSLSNTGESLELRSSAGSILSTVNYLPQDEANGTGGTLNYASSTWQAYKESPASSSTLEKVLITNETNTKSTATTSNTNQSYTSYGSNRFTMGDLKVLTPKEINTVVGAETEFFVKNIDSKSNVVITNTYWSYGDGAEGVGTTTKHRYQNPGVYNAFVESEVSNSYGSDRITVKVETPDVQVRDVQPNYVELYNNSNVELNIGRFIISSDQGMYQLSRMFIISPQASVRIDGRVMGFSNLTNVKLMSAYNTFISKYENKSVKEIDKSQILNENSATTTLLKNITSQRLASENKTLKTQKKSFKIKPKHTYTNNTKSAPSIKTPIAKVIIDAPQTQSTPAVEKASINLSKKWLYWLYE